MNHEQSGNSDEMWQRFSQAEALASEQLEQAYAQIEIDNRNILRRVAGISDPGLTYSGPITEGALPPPDLSNPAGNDSLLLRPDTRATLQAQGERPDVVEKEGNPYTIFGEVPSETKAMIAHLMAATNADYDQLFSTEGHAVWRGNVEGQPIRLELYRDEVVPDERFDEQPGPRVYMRAFREEATG